MGDARPLLWPAADPFQDATRVLSRNSAGRGKILYKCVHFVGVFVWTCAGGFCTLRFKLFVALDIGHLSGENEKMHTPML